MGPWVASRKMWLPLRVHSGNKLGPGTRQNDSLSVSLRYHGSPGVSRTASRWRRSEIFVACTSRMRLETLGNKTPPFQLHEQGLIAENVFE